jgi:[ribosomal protein S5]-alanine N-acetyltransferase
VTLTTFPEGNRAILIRPAYWRQGVASEVLDALDEYWFDHLGFPKLKVGKACQNTASRALSIQRGMRFTGMATETFVAGKMGREIWEITRDEWRAGRDGDISRRFSGRAQNPICAP